MVDINWLAVVLAAVSSMVIGTIWYAPGVFGNRWRDLVKKDSPKRQMGKPGPALVAAFILSLVMAYILAHVSYLSNEYFHHSFMQDAVTTAFWLWLGVAFTRTVTHDQFENRPLTLTLMNVGNMLVTMLAMGVIIGWLQP